MVTLVVNVLVYRNRLARFLKEESMRKIVLGLVGVGLSLLATVTDASAGGPVAAPEINPTSLSAGLALLTGGVLLARARFRK